MQRRQLVTVFLKRGRAVLVMRPPARNGVRRDRWTVPQAGWSAGEPVDRAVTRAVEQLGAPAAAVLKRGLAVDTEESAGRRREALRLHPVLMDAPAVAVPQGTMDVRWIDPDELILLCATGEAGTELDEALARVWDPPAALPPQLRDEARALASTSPAASLDLAGRAAALVHAGAPAERVAALRPMRAAVVNAARRAARGALEATDGLPAAAVRMREALALAAARPAGCVREVEAVLPGGALVVAAPPGNMPIIALVDGWRDWPDDIPPPLEPGYVIIPPSRVALTQHI